MSEDQAYSGHAIGLTGSFGSGCSYLAEQVLEGQGYRRLSLSEILKDMFREETGKDPKKVPRRELQGFGDKLREQKGADFLAKDVAQSITSELQKRPDAKFVIDSIRNPGEVQALRQLPIEFFLFGIYAEKEIRWERVRGRYEDDKRTFDEDDRNDRGGDDSRPHGQRVGDCFYEADIIVSNNRQIQAVNNEPFRQLVGRIMEYADLVAHPLAMKQPLSNDEALMTMAYAVSQRSSCSQRKVGAIIADEAGDVIASGFNEVPRHERPCKYEYTKCYRAWFRDQSLTGLGEQIPAIAGHEDEIRQALRKQYKNMDLCRALYAEENAILGLTRNGRSTRLDECTLYTTTYPCRLCANKIVNVGIRKVVYVEPYPDDRAKAILRNAEVASTFFEGVTSRAYFRIYGERK